MRLGDVVVRQSDRLYRFFLVDDQMRTIGRSSAGAITGQREGSFAITAFTNGSGGALPISIGTTIHLIIAPEPR